MTPRALFRILARAPFLSAIVISSLAVGVGVNTVIFSWLREVAFDPLPGVRGDGLVSLETLDDTGRYVTTSWAEYLDLRERVPSLSGIALQRNRPLSLGDPAAGERVSAQMVSDNFFAVLGVSPALGRTFAPDEGRHAGDQPVVVLSHEFWLKQFHGDPRAVGGTIRLNGRVCTIVGVAPRGFYGGLNAVSFDLWAPAAFAREFQPSSTELTDRKARYFSMLARMPAGVSAARVQGELDAAARYLLDTYPETNRGLGYTLLPLWRSPRGGQAMVLALATLQFFAALILAVVCANTAGLLLAHASTRRREIGVRRALGAAPSRIVLQLLGESVTLAACAVLGGYIVALWGGDLLRHLPFSLPGGLHLRVATELDGPALLFGSGLALACGVAFGLAPALQLARADVIDSLRSGAGALPGRSRLRDALVALEVGLALVLLVLAGLFSTSFRHALAANPGFDVDRVLLTSLDLTSKGYNADRTRAFTDDLLRRLRETPGIAGASVSNSVLLDLHGLPTGVIAVAGAPFDPNAKIRYAYASPGHLQTLGMPLRAGEDLAPLDRTDLPVDAVINERMAQLYWPGVSPVGRKFIVNDTRYVVSGVVRDARYESVNEPPLPLAWLTLRSRPTGFPVLHVRTEGDPRLALGAIRQVVRQLDATLPLLEVRTLAQHVENNLIVQRIPAQMLAFLGPLALVLAAIGLYAIIAYALAQRTREIGVRLALGASPQRVVNLMVWQGLRTVLIGSAVGWLVALALGYLLQRQLVGVRFGEPAVYAGVPALLLGVALLACWLPARRAARVDPMVALRAE